MKRHIQQSPGTLCVLSNVRTLRRKAAFSLVEIALAIAIVAFAFLALIGVVPSGLGTFRAAMNTHTAAEIYRRLAAEVQETDFDTLLDAKVSVGGFQEQFYQLPLRYFDEQGEEVDVANPATLTSTEQARVVYTARIRGSLPGHPDPQRHSVAHFTSLPGLNAPRFNPREATYLTVEIALTRGRDVSAWVDPATLLLNSAEAAKAGVSVKTYSVLLTRNGFASR